MFAKKIRKTLSGKPGSNGFCPEPPAKQLTRVFVISDTHLGASFSDRTEAESVLARGLDYDRELSRIAREGLEDKKNPAQISVLLGDIYEYISHPMKKDENAMRQVLSEHMGHLYAMVKEHPGCKFIYVLGNHERMPLFDEAIDALAGKVGRELGAGRLEIARQHVKIADGLFMHGDLAIQPGKYPLDENHPRDYSGKDGRYEEAKIEVAREDAAQKLHDAAIVALPWTLLWRPKDCARRILAWCHGTDERHKDRPSILEGVSHIFFAHTHVPLLGFDYRDPAEGEYNTMKGWYHFHNTGAPLRRLGPGGHVNRGKFNALNVYIDEEAAHPRIAEVTSFKWPERSWPQETLAR